VHLRARSHMAFLHIYGFMYLLFQYDIFVIIYTFINVFSPQVSYSRAKCYLVKSLLYCIQNESPWKYDLTLVIFVILSIFTFCKDPCL
jgi:hypothetical protein